MTNTYLDVDALLGFSLPRNTIQDQARLAALSQGIFKSAKPGRQVSYLSSGLLLIIGPASTALSVANELAAPITPLILATDFRAILTPTPTGCTTHKLAGREVPVFHGSPLAISGHLGAFTVHVRQDGRKVDLAKKLGPASSGIDLILDLGRNPIIHRERLPDGYFATGGDSKRLYRALKDIPKLIGPFHKPVYVHYESGICAHEEKGIAGCTRCLDVCPAGALKSVAGRIEVDPHLCQGTGTCVMVCPTGAMRYGVPDLGQTLDSLRRVIATFRAQTAVPPSVLLFGRGQVASQLADQVEVLPEEVIPWRMEEVGSTGLELWLSMIAYGADTVFILTPDKLPPATTAALRAQVQLASVLLEALELGRHQVRVISPVQFGNLSSLCGNESARKIKPATYGGLNEKRTVLRFALEHMVEGLESGAERISLPVGSPLGGIEVDAEACTLCLGCVAVCPVNALEGDTQAFRLSLRESDCVQCGICETACPEEAITLVPRLLLDRSDRASRQVLHQDTPFCCIDCGTPFTTRTMIERLEEKLSGHRMFQGNALKLLHRCEDCRVKAV